MTKLESLVKEYPTLDKWMSESSNFILEAKSLYGRGKLDLAFKKYKKAAEMEWQLYKFLKEHECEEDAMDSLISCGSCWDAVGNSEVAKKVFSVALQEAPDEQTREFCQEFINKAIMVSSTVKSSP